jgi:hypothetical protein
MRENQADLLALAAANIEPAVESLVSIIASDAFLSQILVFNSMENLVLLDNQPEYLAGQAMIYEVPSSELDTCNNKVQDIFIKNPIFNKQVLALKTKFKREGENAASKNTSNNEPKKLKIKEEYCFK